MVNAHDCGDVVRGVRVCVSVCVYRVFVPVCARVWYMYAFAVFMYEPFTVIEFGNVYRKLCFFWIRFERLRGFSNVITTPIWTTWTGWLCVVCLLTGFSVLGVFVACLHVLCWRSMYWLNSSLHRSLVGVCWLCDNSCPHIVKKHFFSEPMWALAFC